MFHFSHMNIWPSETASWTESPPSDVLGEETSSFFWKNFHHVVYFFIGKKKEYKLNKEIWWWIWRSVLAPYSYILSAHFFSFFVTFLFNLSVYFFSCCYLAYLMSHLFDNMFWLLFLCLYLLLKLFVVYFHIYQSVVCVSTFI